MKRENPKDLTYRQLVRKLSSVLSKPVKCHKCGVEPSKEVGKDYVKVCDLYNKGEWECSACHFDCIVKAEKEGILQPNI